MECNVVDETTEVHVINAVGLSQNHPLEKRVIAGTNWDDREEELARLTRCADTPCILNVDPRVDDGSESDLPASTASVQLMSGIPNVLLSSDAKYPYTKQIAITAEGAVLHTMFVVVTGDLSDKPPRHISFPTVKPFMILRDPPGGDSATVYNRIETTVTLSSESHDKYMGHSFDLSVAPKFKFEYDLSIGLGLSPGPEAGADIVEGELEPGVGSISHSVNSIQEHQESESKAGFTMEWSYSTAGQEGAKNGQVGAGIDLNLLANALTFDPKNPQPPRVSPVRHLITVYLGFIYWKAAKPTFL